MFRCFIPVALLLSFSGAAEAGTHKHKSSKGGHAHEHGAAKLNIVVEGTKIAMEFESPSESVYGFEHEAKTAKEKLAVESAVKKLKENLAGAFVFDKKLACRLEATKIEPWVKEEGHGSGEHSEFRAEIVSSCAAAPTGTKMKIGLSKLFPKIHEVRVQVLNGEKQLGMEIEKDKGEISL
jgi:hypothetical protein